MILKCFRPLNSLLGLYPSELDTNSQVVKSPAREILGIRGESKVHVAGEDLVTCVLVGDTTPGHSSDQESLRSLCSTTKRLQCTMSPCRSTSNCDISAVPPALSEMKPKASMVSPIAMVPSMRRTITPRLTTEIMFFLRIYKGTVLCDMR